MFFPKFPNLNLKKGFAGLRCETRINECLSNPCVNGATCQQVLNDVGFNCFCPPGFTGLLCDKLIAYCRPDLCKNGATCVEKPPAAYQCNCAPGFTGVDCSIQID